MEIDFRRQSLAIPIRETHDVGDARRQAMRAGKAVGFDETANGRVGIVATELAGNLVKHAGGGALILRVAASIEDTSAQALGLEIMSLDDGPGMNVQRCMEDGYSTAGSPGTGLGAIKRLATGFEAYSLPGKGTVIVTQLWPDAAHEDGLRYRRRLSAGGRGTAMRRRLERFAPGQACSTSSSVTVWVTVQSRRRPAMPRWRCSRESRTWRRSLLLETMHAAMRATRGAAVLAGHLDTVHNRLTCAGTGNIAGYIMAQPRPKGIVSMNGIVGHQIHKVKEFSYDCGPEDLIILHSDGLTTHWKLDDFPGLASRSASLIAGMMFKHFKRGKDDATVVVVRRQ